ncbi:MAG: molybdopterin-dependent oxidoreductase [Acidobacteriaceae bacterium]|nr:molybdopterin-dependent oxidoreductase [Acidobacteriaceae bacterium]
MNKTRDVILSEGELRRQTRRAFLIGAAATAAGTGGYLWIHSHQDSTGIPKVERAVLNGNGRLWRSYVSNTRLMPTYSGRNVQRLKPNGNIGLTSPVEDDWTLAVATGTGPALTLNLDDIKALPRVEIITKFCCIEGWSSIVQWAGARFADFTRKYFPPDRPLPPYVSLTTPDQDYYVGLDMRSALHPQTLLAYEHNGKPLTPEHGAPLRLAIPVKYGIKNIKRIGSIEYTSKKPSDYWAEEGYDWFAGL